ncbi:uncharacterized protein RSE6_14622 [Rhynchosporium secalis]|uniref:Uncharacterized protein n=1 Tax=Rhynchosporium secalis TaxID=38038 RepID=A0A1E1MVP7_RHYSE|nr:uncharacterized protein RSE6_14622 [Rhynchosporium secalis]
MAVKLVNERLRGPFVPLSNETIAEVAIMAAFESSNGTRASMMVHIDDLRENGQYAWRNRGRRLPSHYPNAR